MLRLLDYAMSVIPDAPCLTCATGSSRAPPHALRDAQLGLAPTRSYAKCAVVAGDVLGNYHPHGHSSMYDTLVRMAQDFSMRYPLITAKATSARSTTIRRRRCATPRPCRASPRSCCAISTRIPSIRPPTTTALFRNPTYFPPLPNILLNGPRDRRGHGDLNPAAQPARAPRRHHHLHRPSRVHVEDLMPYVWAPISRWVA